MFLWIRAVPGRVSRGGTLSKPRRRCNRAPGRSPDQGARVGRTVRRSAHDPIFPQEESGWDDLLQQILACKKDGIPYLVLDSTAFRNQPELVLPKLFARLGLPFSTAMLRWDSREDLCLGNLDTEQDHWYDRVLESTGLQPATATPRALEEFPAGLRPHLRDCLDAYRGLLRDEHFISA